MRRPSLRRRAPIRRPHRRSIARRPACTSRLRPYLALGRSVACLIILATDRTGPTARGDARPEPQGRTSDEDQTVARRRRRRWRRCPRGPRRRRTRGPGHRGQGPRQPVLRADQPRLPEVDGRERRIRQYKCLYTGPASSADEAGEVQIVEDLLNRPDVKAIAISPSNAPAMGNMVRRVAPTDPGDDHRRRLRRGRPRPAQDLSRHRQLPDGRADGASTLKELKPEGGTVCLQLGNVAADNINARAAGFRDTIAGAEGHRAADRPGRLDRDRWLPGLHQRPDRPRQPADAGRLHRQPRPRRLHPGRRLGAVRAAGLCAGDRRR